MDKAFDPTAVEPKWRSLWEQGELGRADPSSDKPPFVIALPPPNITGRLHLGHACGFSIQDALARYHRMRGFEVEWCPGTDHAAIATNAVIERMLASQGTSKEDLGRERFQQTVDAWYQEYGGYILGQMRSLGFSCDWSRLRFTLDQEYERAIRVVFKALYDEGLIYRGPRIVNWCPHDRSAISDEEIEWQEHVDRLTYLRYPIEEGGDVTIATVRPETMLGDSAVAVSPDDPRFADLVGKTVVLPIVGRRIPIIADSAVKPEFGTGCLKVTPAHDPTDYDIGQRHNLPMISVIASDGTMDVPDLPRFHGMEAGRAREAVVAALDALGVVVRSEEYTHEVGHCDRCGHVLEPLISAQWWVAMKKLAEPGIAVAESGEVVFHPERYRAVYLNWMNNIRDWCISRQIWLGHAIPVSTCANGHRFAWIEHPDACPECGSGDLTDDPDVLDTWFSSALWPFAIFGWPDDTADLQRFYPTDVLVTAREIIFLWVARMIMTGLRFAGGIPFHHVLISSTILARDGSRMSKSKGNAVDPAVMIEKYGADAVRGWAAAVGTSGQDLRFDEERIEAFRRFANKLWNVTRLLVSRLGDEQERIPAPADAMPPLEREDSWMLARLAETIDGCDAAIGGYRFHEAMDRIYDTVWHTFCDWYVEMAKPRLEAGCETREAAVWTLTTTLDTLLRVLHPFMPFVTEECAQHLQGAADSLDHRPWPVVDPAWRAGVDGVDGVLALVQAVRTARHDAGARPDWKQRDRLVIAGAAVDSELMRLVSALDPVVVEHGAAPEGAVRVIAAGYEASLVLSAGTVHDNSETLRRQLREAQEQAQRYRTQLDNPRFVERARPEVVEETRRRLAAAEERTAALRRMLGEAA